jgi:hypothetical protein
MERRQFAVARRLFHEEHKYDGPLPRKAVHKLLYLLNAEAEDEGLDVDLPYFWFQYGVVTPAEAKNTQGQLAAEPSDERQSTEQESALRPLVRRLLRRYYSTSLEVVTDETYRDAPYAVQREWRVLDKKLRTLHPEYPDFYEVEPSRDAIEESIFDVYESFQTGQFPELEDDLTKWYSMITRELNQPEVEPDLLMEINVLFWRIFSLCLAEEHRHHMTKAEIRDILEIESFDAARETCRDELDRIESEILEAKFEEDDQFDTSETRTADAIAAGVVNEHLRTHSD